MAIDFKAAKVGIDFKVSIDGFVYDIATPGRTAAPGNGGLDFAQFVSGTGTATDGYGFNTFLATSPGGPACVGATACNASLTGRASGSRASGFGVQYSIAPPRGSGSPGTVVTGVAAFQATGPTG